jgi:hypothetical protein
MSDVPPTYDELLEINRQQAREIEALRARSDQLPKSLGGSEQIGGRTNSIRSPRQTSERENDDDFSPQAPAGAGNALSVEMILEDYNSIRLRVLGVDTEDGVTAQELVLQNPEQVGYILRILDKAAFFGKKTRDVKPRYSERDAEIVRLRDVESLDWKALKRRIVITPASNVLTWTAGPRCYSR